MHRYRPKDETLDPIIECNVLVDPYFFERSNWIPIPASFALNVVSGKSDDTQTEEGRSLWESVRRAMSVVERVEDSGAITTELAGERFGEAYLARSRLGLGLAWGFTVPRLTHCSRPHLAMKRVYRCETFVRLLRQLRPAEKNSAGRTFLWTR